MCLGAQINPQEYSWLKILAMISKLKTLLKSIQSKKLLLIIFILTSKMTVSYIRTACLMFNNSLDRKSHLDWRGYRYVKILTRISPGHIFNLYHVSRNSFITYISNLGFSASFFSILFQLHWRTMKNLLNPRTLWTVAFRRRKLSKVQRASAKMTILTSL